MGSTPEVAVLDVAGVAAEAELALVLGGAGS